MHAAVYLDMNRVVLQPFRLRRGNYRLERLMRIDVRLEVVLQDDIHRGYLRVHDDDRQSDTCAAEFHSFVCDCYGQIVYQTALLQGFAYFHTTCAIRKRFHHTSQFGLGFQQVAKITHVVHQGCQVHFHHRLVCLMEDAFRDGLFVVT